MRAERLAGADRDSRLGSPLRAPRTTTLALQLAVVVAAFAYGAWHFGSFQNLGVKLNSGCGIFLCDFVRHFYPTAAEIARSGLPTRGYYYTPVLAVLLAPLSALSPGTTAIVWVALQGILWLLLCLLPPHWKPGCPRWLAVAFSAVTALCVPFLENFSWGQVSTIITSLVLVAFVLHERGQRLLAALALGLAIGLKLYPAAYLVWFAIRRDLRFVGLALLAAAVFLVGLPAVALGPSGAVRFYFAVVRQVESDAGWIRTNSGSQYFASVVGRSLGHPDSAAIRWVLGCIGDAAALLAALLLLLAERRRIANLSIWAFCMISCSLPFLLKSSWLHYFTYLPIVQLFLLSQVTEGRLSRATAAAAVGLVILPSVVVSNVIFHEHVAGGDPIRYAAIGYLSHANTALFLLGAGLLHSRARSRRDAGRVGLEDRPRSPNRPA